jgi:hypothetical protein
MTIAGNPKIHLNWEKKFLLQDAFMLGGGGAGIYVWGFEDHKGEVVWYVGKSTKKKGIYSRLRKHYLDIMSGQYQIPRGFLNKGVFETDECSGPAWELEHRNPAIAATLKDWTKMEAVFRAGHLFANSAFARVALVDLPDTDLADVERSVIHLLNPVINNQRRRSETDVEMIPNQAESNWMDHWRRRTASK